MGYSAYCPFLEITTQNTNSFMSADPKLCTNNPGKHKQSSIPLPHTLKARIPILSAHENRRLGMRTGTIR